MLKTSIYKLVVSFVVGMTTLLSGTLLFTACTTEEQTTATKTELIGGDKDEHGCIASAGYSWCAKTYKCERPWELAEKEKFKKSAEAFNSFCGNK